MSVHGRLFGRGRRLHRRFNFHFLQNTEDKGSGWWKNDIAEQIGTVVGCQQVQAGIRGPTSNQGGARQDRAGRW